MIFKTSLGKSVMFITVAVSIVFAIILISLNSIPKLFFSAESIITSVFLLLSYFGVFAFRPLNYIVQDKALIIKRPLKDVQFLKTDIQSVELVNNDNMKGTIRTFGVGGLFGYFGTFSNYKIGKMTWYATRRNKLVLMKTMDNKNIILTPNEPGEFVAAFVQ